MKNAILAFMILSYFSICAQHTEKYLHNYQYTSSENCVVNDEHIFVQKSNCNFFDFNCDNVKVMKLDFGLNLMDSIDLTTFIQKDWFRVMAMDYSPNNELIVVGNYRELTNNNDCPYFFKTIVFVIDPYFNSIDTFNLSYANDSSMSVIFNMKAEDDFIRFCGYDIFCTSHDRNAIVVEMDYSGNLKDFVRVDKTEFLPWENQGPIFSDVTKFNNKYLALNGSLMSDKQLIILDDSLNFLEAKRMAFPTIKETGFNHFLEFENHLPKVYTMGTVDKRSVGGTWPPDSGTTPFYKYLSLISLDSSFNMARLDTFSHSFDKEFEHGALDFPKVYPGTIDYYHNSDSTILMGTDAWTTYFNYGWKPSSNTYIHSINALTGSVNWSKVYNNGYAHMGHKVVALPGNRTLLMFNEYNWDKYPYENLSVHLMIIDGEGNPIGIPENEKLPAQKPVVFPNPASGQVHIKDLDWAHPGGFTYRISDLNGRNIAEGKLGKNTPVSLDGISSGLYIISIVNQHGVGWAEKLVVE